MPNIEHQLTALYVFVDDCLQAQRTLASWRHSPHAHPAFSDAEVLTLALLQGCLGVASLKQTYRLVAANWRSAFPQLCSYGQWLARLHALSGLLGALLRATTNLSLQSPAFYLIDSKPIPVCSPLRHRRVRLLREAGAYFGKTGKGWFFGFKLHVLRHIEGRIVNLILTPGNWDDREALLPLVQGVDGGITLGDLGYQGRQRAEECAEEADMFVFTRAEAPAQQLLLTQVREVIETTFSQLWYQFVDRVFSRSWQGLWHTIQLKVIHYNLCQAGVLST
jgi:IS5 family transposase